MLRDEIMYKIVTIHEMREQVSSGELVLLVRGARTLDWSDRPDIQRRIDELAELMLRRQINSILAPLDKLARNPWASMPDQTRRRISNAFLECIAGVKPN